MRDGHVAFTSAIILDEIKLQLLQQQKLCDKPFNFLLSNHARVMQSLSFFCYNSVYRPVINNLERFSFECRKVIGFALSTRCDWLKRFAPPFHPIRSKTKANCDALACIFPRFGSATCNYFEF